MSVDRSEIPWPTAVHPWAKSIDDETVYLDDGRAVYGIDWTTEGNLPAVLSRVPPDTDLLVMHQVCDEFMGDLTRPELEVANLPDVPHVLIGDYHDMRVVDLPTGGKLLSPGSTNIRQIAENPKKRVLVLYDDGSVKAVALKSRGVIEDEQITDTSLDDDIARVATTCSRVKKEKIDAGVPSHIAPPLVRFKAFAHSAGVADRMIDAMGAEFADRLFLSRQEAEQQEVADDGQTVARLGDAQSAAGRVFAALDSIVDSRDDPDTHLVCRSLLRSESASEAAETLKEIRKSYGIGTRGGDPEREFATESWDLLQEPSTEEGEEICESTA